MKVGDQVWYWTRHKGEQHARRQWGMLRTLGEEYARVELPRPSAVTIRVVTVHRSRLRVEADLPEALRRI